MIRTAGLGIVAGIGLLFFGQASPEPTVELIGNWGAVGVLGFLAFWLCTKTLPQQGTDFRSAVKEIADRQHEDSRNINETLRAMTVHCATVQRESERA